MSRRKIRNPTKEESKINTRVVKRNDQALKGKQVRVVNASGDAKVVDFNKAIQMAENAGLDLVAVAENSNPPVVRMMDYGKEQYRQAKAEKKNKQQVTKNKEVKFTACIEDHDYNVKVNQIKKFLDKKMRVRVTIFFKGREMSRSESQRKESGQEIFDRVIADVEGLGKVDVPPKISGRNMFMTLVHE